MPIYDFKCKECGEVSEFLVATFSASRALACPSCGSQNIDRLMSAPSLLRHTTDTPGTTCCGQAERCETPPCSTGEGCWR